VWRKGAEIRGDGEGTYNTPIYAYTETRKEEDEERRRKKKKEGMSNQKKRKR
jgi:hypothetical protein